MRTRTTRFTGCTRFHRHVHGVFTSASVAREDSSCLAVCAGGAGVSSTSDQFHFVYQETSGDAVLTAQLSELAPEGQLADVGVMLRESLDPGARYAAVFVEGPAVKRFRFRYRQDAGDRSRSERGEVAELPDAWVQIRRSGANLIGFSSPDGEEWTEIGRANMDFPEAFLSGVAASGRERFPDQPYVAIAATVCNLRLNSPVVTFRFVRGDGNADGKVDISDATYTLNWLFLDGTAPDCLATMNANGDTTVDISDAGYLLNFLFSGGAAPVDPFPDCGPGTLEADRELGCANPPGC